MSASAPVLAEVKVPSPIDDLVNTSASIRSTFDHGIRLVGGMMNLANDGLIAPTGTAASGHISYGQAEAYNAALTAVQQATFPIDVGAQEYFENAADQAMNNVNVAVDSYVQAAYAVIEVVRVNEIASDAQAAGNNEAAAAVQEYITTNDVTLQDAEVDLYNDALTNVEGTTQTAAAFMAVASSPELINSANEQASNLDTTYAEATESFFDAATGDVTVKFNEVTTTVAVSVSSYFTTTSDILTEGETSDFYTTGPTYDPCKFFQDPSIVSSCSGG